MKKTQLAKAIALTISGAALAGIANTASASTTMYNTFNHGTTSAPTPNNIMAIIGGSALDSGSVGTDGWTHTVAKSVFGNVQPASHAAGPGTQGALLSDLTAVPWVGGGASAPFGYNGGRVLHWGIDLSGAGDNGNISSADSNKYTVNGGSFYADIDSAAGAWRDNQTVTQGWSHDLDIGLLKSDVTQQVTLSIGSVGNASAEYGITVYEGMDNTAINGYNHHASWHGNSTFGDGSGVTPGIAPDNTIGPVGDSPLNPHGFSSYDAMIAENIDASGWSLNELVFTAEAGKVYTIMLGGYMGGQWNDTREHYSLDVTTSPVPVPAAAWLFGSAFAGLGMVGRRKRKEA